MEQKKVKLLSTPEQFFGIKNEQWPPKRGHEQQLLVDHCGWRKAENPDITNSTKSVACVVGSSNLTIQRKNQEMNRIPN